MTARTPPPGSGHALLRAWFERHPEVKKADFAERLGVSPSALSQYIAERPEDRNTPKAGRAALIEIETAGDVPAAAWDTAEDRERVRAALARQRRAAGGSR